MLHALKEVGLHCFEPRGAFYAFPSVKASGLPAEEFSEKLLQSKKVAVVPGSAFGAFGADNVRISYATGMAALGEAFEKIGEFMREIKR